MQPSVVQVPTKKVGYYVLCAQLYILILYYMKNADTNKINIYIPLRIDLDPVFDDLFNSLYTRFMTAEGYTTFPDVRRTLIQLRQRGFQMGIISNSDERVCMS